MKEQGITEEITMETALFPAFAIESFQKHLCMPNRQQIFLRRMTLSLNSAGRFLRQ
jgi:hypothetical protein